jgi:hypothetical protein
MAQRLKRGEKNKKNHFFTPQYVCVCCVCNNKLYDIILNIYA